MVLHTFICDNCNLTIQDPDTKKIHHCARCDKGMRWDLRGVGIAPGDYEHVSDSLAISPDQTQEHKQMFPDVDVLEDGRLRFTSVRQHETYLNKTGFYKKTQKIRRKLNPVKGK